MKTLIVFVAFVAYAAAGVLPISYIVPHPLTVKVEAQKEIVPLTYSLAPLPFAPLTIETKPAEEEKKIEEKKEAKEEKAAAEEPKTPEIALPITYTGLSPFTTYTTGLHPITAYTTAYNAPLTFAGAYNYGYGYNYVI